jgi:hypothetical protein
MLAIKVSFQPLKSLIDFTPVRLQPVPPSPSRQLEWQEYPIPADLSARPVSNVRRIRVFLVTVVKIGNASLLNPPLPTRHSSQFPKILPRPTHNPFLTSPFSPRASMDYTACSYEVSLRETRQREISAEVFLYSISIANQFPTLKSYSTR